MMKETGIVRGTDDLGRVVVPAELRRTLNWDIREKLEIFNHGDCVVLRKYQTSCIFCGGTHNLTEFKGKVLCGKCRGNLKDIANGKAPVVEIDEDVFMMMG